MRKAKVKGQKSKGKSAEVFPYFCLFTFDFCTLTFRKEAHA